MDKTICFACGGSGGHLFPAQEIAKRLKSSAVFMGAGLESSPFFDRKKFQYHEIPSMPLKSWSFLKVLLPSVYLAVKKLRQIDPACVIGFGSYHTFPVILAALLLRIPIDLFEMNSTIGLVNRFFVRFARRIYTCFLEHPKAVKITPPIQTKSIEKNEALARYGLVETKPVVLIFGGSQGAKVFEHLTIPNQFQVVHFAGKHVDLESLKKRYESQGVNAYVASYEKQMEYAWSAADIAITRSGAMTISEAKAYQVPCLMIPYPYAKDQHQLKNAQFAAKNWHAGIVLPQQKLNQVESKLKTLYKQKDHWFDLALFSEGDQRVEDYLEGVLFLGVGGIGMSSLATIAKEEGLNVLGYDDYMQEDKQEKLIKAGIKVLQKIPSHLPCNRVVCSSAISGKHPGRVLAAEEKIPVLHRSEFLAQMMEKKKAICISGTHGKTSVSGLLAYALSQAGYDPSFMVGGYLKNFSQNGRRGEGELFIVEADESDGSFLNYHPEYSILTNLEEDHLDHWGNLENIEQGFLQFFSQTKQQVFWCFDDPGLNKLFKGKGMSYGFMQGADVRLIKEALDESIKLTIQYQNTTYSLNTPLLAHHQLLNFGAIIALWLHLKIDLEGLEGVITSFQGISRRMDYRGKTSKGFHVYDDYAHHPTEILLTYLALKQKVGQEPVVVFQPHRFSRTQALFSSFVTALQNVKDLIITDVYSAGEDKTTIDAKTLAAAIGGACRYIPKEKLKEFLISRLSHQDVLITMGAGDITKLSEELVCYESKVTL